MRKTSFTPDREYRRRETAQRRHGENNACEGCGESRPEALIGGRRPPRCARCERESHGQATEDLHHVAGRSNHAVTIPVPVNDHRARLSPEQNNWPSRTLRNPDRSPLLAGAACIRGFIDVLRYLLDEVLQWLAEELENLDEILGERLGPQWWRASGEEGKKHDR